MQLLIAILLGLVQGLTEFIPVSSSGHLVLAEHFVHFSLSGYAFDAVLNVGTLAALLLYFWRDWLALLKGALRPGSERRLFRLIVIGTIPAVLVGFLMQSFIEAHTRSPWLVATALILMAFVMLAAEKRAKLTRPLTDLNTKDSVAVGLAQTLAFIPGVSRSGTTIVAGMMRGLKREAATRYSFFLALPILAGGTLKILTDRAVLDSLTSHLGLYVAANLAAFISGYLAIGWLLGYLANHKLNLFAYYRIGLAVIILLTLGL